MARRDYSFDFLVSRMTESMLSRLGYRVIATVTEIIRLYHEVHGNSVSYEFSGEFKKGTVLSGSAVNTAGSV